MTKYEFKAVSLDDFEFHYTKDGKEIVKPFKRTVELAKKLQGTDAEARFKMYEYLTSVGKSKKDLVIEVKHPDGTITVDETNYREFEASFMIQEQYKMAQELYKSLFGMTLEEIIKELDLNDNEAYLFGAKVRELVINGANKDEFPSRTDAE